MAKVLVACEYSGIVRDAFRDRGHDAISCDLRPTLQGGPHAQGDVRLLLGQPWDLVIAHPPCTYLSKAGVRWLSNPERWPKMVEAATFYMDCLSAKSPRVCVENPRMHRPARQMLGEPDQRISAAMFGETRMKHYELKLRGLPSLMATTVNPDPVPDRGTVPKSQRSLFFPAIAAAMADQWGPLLP